MHHTTNIFCPINFVFRIQCEWRWLDYFILVLTGEKKLILSLISGLLANSFEYYKFLICRRGLKYQKFISFCLINEKINGSILLTLLLCSLRISTNQQTQCKCWNHLAKRIDEQSLKMV